VPLDHHTPQLGLGTDKERERGRKGREMGREITDRLPMCTMDGRPCLALPLADMTLHLLSHAQAYMKIK